MLVITKMRGPVAHLLCGVPRNCSFRVIGYRQAADPVARPCVVFALRHDDESFCAYSQRKLIHIAGMVRHLAVEMMQIAPPAGVPADWVERYVAGHRDQESDDHRQLSYLPLPSIGHAHSDHAVRRVMIAAPVGDEAWLEHLAGRLAGQPLRPENGNEFSDAGPPTLQRVDPARDKVAKHYVAPANRWASVTPVILPGHDDRKRSKTVKLIERALREAGIEQPCEYEWSPVSRFAKALSAHKYHKDRQTDDKHWQFENVKEYLRDRTWTHLTLTFNDGVKVPGPLAIGAGRHCGFGLLAACK